jgi:hypothetical protein
MMAFKPKNAFLAFSPRFEQNTPYVYIDFPLKMHICLILMIID